MKEDEYIATLVEPGEYAKNVNQIARVSAHTLLFVKRKEFAFQPFELLEYPMNQCSSITYEIKWAVVPMVFGVFLVALISLIIVGLFSFDLPDNTKVPVGAMAIALFFGTTWLGGPKRHRLTFIINDKKLRWQSKAGDFKYKIASVQKIVAFAKKKCLYRESFR